MRTLSFALLLLAAPYAAAPAAAQTSLVAQHTERARGPLAPDAVFDEAKAHYAAASYEEALSALTRIDGALPDRRAEVEQYRAFCLIALGRLDEAERAVAALVEADPKYVPSPDVASPRVLTLVTEMRGRELPQVARRLLDEGRTAFKDKDFIRAQDSFDLLLELLDEPAMRGSPEREDLQLLAESFATLAVAVPAVAVQPEPEPEPTLEPAARPAPVAAVVQPAVVVQQDIPMWIPPDVSAGAREYRGLIRVHIGIDGRVDAADIEQPTHPAFDVRLLRAAKEWLYIPATRNGQPVPSERLVTVQLTPRR